MLGTIAQIASIISALTALTTSLRALGKSREYSGLGPRELYNRLLLYLAVTVIWFVLSILFIVPVLIKGWVNEKYMKIFLWLLPFLLLFFMLLIVWRRIMSFKK